MTRMASFYCGKTQRTEIENVPCHSDPASCAAYEESQGTSLLSGIETVLAILGSFASLTRGSAQDDENGFVLLRENAKDRNILSLVPCFPLQKEQPLFKPKNDCSI